MSDSDTSSPPPLRGPFDATYSQSNLMVPYHLAQPGRGFIPNGPYQKASIDPIYHCSADQINHEDIVEDGDRSGPRDDLEYGARSTSQKPKRRKRGVIFVIVVGLIIVTVTVAVVVVNILPHQSNDGNSVINNAKEDTRVNGDLDFNSKEIRDLMNNKDLHKVFPGIEYTPWGVQEPLCHVYPPSQNNVTRDMAVLSRLTNNIRLYGTDCNQTEMVLHAIDRLNLKNMKVWLGVWIDKNITSNERQLQQLYTVIDQAKDKSVFNGVIVGTDAMYHAGSNAKTSKANLINYMKSVKASFAQRNLNLSVATAQTASEWDNELGKEADVIISNVRPFFSGVKVDKAAGWTWSFWKKFAPTLTQAKNKQHIIAEVGWPSGGGHDCGKNLICPDEKDGAVAGVEQMNKFLSNWVCQALENGTNYFW